MTMHSTTFDLGTAGELRSLFAFSPNVKNTTSPAVLNDAVDHAINQTMQRDLFYGAWAVVMNGGSHKWDDDDKYSVRITSPDKDVAAYANKLPEFLQTISQGLAIFADQQQALAEQRTKLVSEYNNDPKKKWRTWTDADFDCSFLPPFGLSMVNTDSIQLLHYPPSETVTYMDYLYSPTNRRWENLLAYSGYPGARNTLVETIVDIAPIAAPGGSAGGDLIAPVLEAFKTYALSMLQTLLRSSDDGKTTQPVVAYGGPVGEWLWKNFPDEIKTQNVSMVMNDAGDPVRPNVCEVFALHLLGNDGPSTPIMCANHPIKFNYYDSDFEKAEHPAKPDPATDQEAVERQVDQTSALILIQDLIAAGWQSELAQKWKTSTDPELFQKVRQNLVARWTNTDSPEFKELFQVFREQVIEFGLHNMPEVSTDEWMQQLMDSIQQHQHIS